MTYRHFKDRDGMSWEIRDRLSSEWDFVPAHPDHETIRVPAPGYQKDPFEVSIEELQRLLDAHHRPGGGPTRPSKPSPFKD